MSLPLQIIAANELEEEEFLSLKMLMPGVKEKEIRKFLAYMRTLEKPGDRRDAEAVLRVSVSANVEVYKRAGREDEMVNQVVWRLFGDEIEEAIADDQVSYIKIVMKKLKMTEQEAMDFLDIPQDKHAKYTEMLANEMEHKKG